VHPLLLDLAAVGQAEHLVAAAVGQHGSRPADELVEAASPRNQLVAGSQIQVIGIAEDDLGPDIFEMLSREGLDHALRADGHEGRGLNDTASGGDVAAARRAVCVGEGEDGHDGLRLEA